MRCLAALAAGFLAVAGLLEAFVEVFGLFVFGRGVAFGAAGADSV